MPLTKPKPTFKKSGSPNLDIPRFSSKRKSRGEWLRVKDFLDGFVVQVKTPQFRVRDPIFYPAQHLDDPTTAEWVGFLSALFSYGRREKIMENLAWIFQRMEGDPKGFLETFHPKKDRKVFQGFVYRFNREEDLLGLCTRLQKVMQRYGSLEQLYLNASSAISNEDPKAFQLKLGT
ncbi:MAG: DUF2400 family protein, partial [Cyanobacteria bacterium]|nr:DUF2400 family protein [Cyanobacteriota bacterium]